MESNSNAPVPPAAQPDAPKGTPDQAASQPTQPAAPPAGQQAGMNTNDPNFILAIVGLVVGFLVLPPAGLVVCIIAYKKSKQAGQENTIALVGAWILGVFTALGALLVAFLLITFLAASQSSSF